jgi:F0F1-type ATP synthase gamma subunit
MEIVSTVKMKRAQDLALEKRDFVLEILKIFLRIEEHMKDFPIFSSPKS